MLYVNIIYHADTRLLEVAEVSTRKNDLLVATRGDDNGTTLLFGFDDPDGVLDGLTPRVEYGVKLVNSDHEVYFPYSELEPEEEPPQPVKGGVQYSSVWSTLIPASVLHMAVNKVLPVQLRFSHTDSETGEKVEFYSLNILKLRVGYAIGAAGPAPPRDGSLNDAVVGVTYDPSTATFTYTQYDGDTIEIRLSDLSEEHFEVPTYDDLTTLTEAQTGDTATTMDTGIWYKLYGSYDNIDDWYMMSGIGVGNISYDPHSRRMTVRYSDETEDTFDLSQHVTFNGDRTKVSRDLVFYAPTDAGQFGQTLISTGYSAPFWYYTSESTWLDFTEDSLIELDNPFGTYEVSCQFIDVNGQVVYPAYKVDAQTITVQCNVREMIEMIATVKLVGQNNPDDGEVSVEEEL